MDVALMLLLIAAALVCLPNGWQWFVSAMSTAYFLLKVVAIIGGRL